MIIGKQGDQKDKITEASVSRQHCRITKIDKGRYLLEDLNSTNGTFVNGQRISVMEVDDNTTIQLGPKYSVRVVNLFIDISKEFDKLKNVYDNYNSQKLLINRNIAKKNLYRSLIPSIISPIILMGSFFFSGQSGDNGQVLIIFRIAMAVIMVVSVLYTTKLAGKAQQESPEKNMQLEKKFRKEYVCPSCKRFLGNIPFEELRDSVKTCPYCKTKWH